MNLSHDVSLADFSTMRLGGKASHLTEVHSRAELTEAVAWAESNQVPILMIGSGSNIVWRDEGFSGLVLVNRFEGFELYEEDASNVYLTAGAGENWDSVVARSAQAGLTGIEALSLVPGTTGATPVQNVGAYGQDISQTLTTLEAYDTQAKQFVTIPASDCAFGYRTSRFKTTDRGRFFITAITLHLTRGNPQPPFYAALQKYLDERNITNFTPQVIRDAVIDIRTSKLPDPAKVANNGSFFANPIISEDNLRALREQYPTIPSWETPQTGQVKIPAAWLLEQAGFKDVHDSATGMATWTTQPLVLVNEAARSTADLLAFKQKIIDTVASKFGITLEQEPELLP